MNGFFPNSKWLVLALFFAGSGLFFQACKKDETAALPTAHHLDGEIATVWMNKFRDLTKTTPGFTPPVAARAFGYAGVTLYETVVPGMPLFQSLAGQLSELTGLPKPDPNLEYDWAVATNAAMAQVARDFYSNTTPDNLISISALETQWEIGLKVGLDDVVFLRSAAWGRSLATNIFEWSKTDGGHEGWSKNFPTSYVAPVGPGFWVPTAPGNKPAMQPYWGNNRTFMPGLLAEAQPPAPLPFSTDDKSAFYAQAHEVFTAVKNRTLEMEKTAKYWSDDPGLPGTPPGHLVAISVQLLEKTDASLARCAEVLAQTNMAISDAFVCCWKCKFDYSLLRPITFIQANIDPAWSPVLATPPFPEYTSGHSSASGAWSQVMTDLYGANYPFIDRTHEARTDIDGSARGYRNFFEAADEAAISRLFGGIHYRDACEIGIQMGRKVGKKTSSLQLQK